MKPRLTSLALAVWLVPGVALADHTLTYRSEGGCAGDFDRIELKGLFLRVDSGGAGSGSGSMIYDHGEKLAYFIDNNTRTFLQTEMDEDAVDLQSDITKSMRIRMRKEGGMDPYEIAKTLCPGAGAGSRDQMPGEPIDCGNGATLGGAMTGADGKPLSAEQMSETMQGGGGAAIDPQMQATMQKLMEQQLSNMPPEQREQVQKAMADGGMLMPGMPQAGAAPRPPKPERIDRDTGEIDVGGITCTRREHLRGGVIAGEDCLAAPAALRLGEPETRRIARFGQSIRAWSESLVPGEMQPKVDDRVVVRRICYAGGRETGRATLAIDTAPIAASRFEVPAGYAPMDTGIGGARGREPR
jgi:hypothetical protein